MKGELRDEDIILNISKTKTKLVSQSLNYIYLFHFKIILVYLSFLSHNG